MCSNSNPPDLIPLPGPDLDPWACVGNECRITIVSVKEARVIEFSFGATCSPAQQKKLIRLAEQRLKAAAESVRGTCPDDCVCIPFADAKFRDTDPLEIYVRPFLIVDPHDPHCFIAVEKASVVIVVSSIDGLCVPLQIDGPGSLLGPDGTTRLEDPRKFPPSVLKRVIESIG